MKHKHIYDAQGKQLCCTQEEKIYHKAGHSHEHSGENESTFKMFLPAIISALLLVTGLILDNYIAQNQFAGRIRTLWYAVACLPVGLPVLKEAFESVFKGEIFSEFMLMSMATAGAFAIGEYPEGVAVMLFYAVGEVFQTLAVKRAKSNIRALLDQRPDKVTVLENGRLQTLKAENVNIGDIVCLKPGEKLGLDGELLSETAAFNTAALTGESRPDAKRRGETVLAGMINLNTVAQVKVTAAYRDSKLSRILELVQNAASQKAPTELFIRKFARIYTPIVVALAVAICLLPSFFVAGYQFGEWLYRALIFLVISCPCALVISIPLGYFGGIGAAGRNGILVKGSNFLDILASVQNVVMDKTGTMTEGVFKVQEAVFNPGFDENEMLQMVNVLESRSTHPIATAVRHFAGDVNSEIGIENVEELAGYGLRATVNGKELLAGNFRMMEKFGIACNMDTGSIVDTVVAIACDRRFAGYLTVADSVKPDAKTTVDRLKQLGVKPAMLSGDKSAVVGFVARQLGIENAFGDLLPEEKADRIKALKAKNETVAFVGDGVNDAPAIALSDVGIAMGGLGSDATIETADVVIQNDMPGKIPVAIIIGKQTKRIVRQNISLAFTVKAAVLLLGAGGLATMWEAVFADVGVALLAILNAVRIQQKKF